MPPCAIFLEKITSWWFNLDKENINVTLKEIILGLPNKTDVINYLLILGKLFIWDCRKICIYPDFALFFLKLKLSKKPTNI